MVTDKFTVVLDIAGLNASSTAPKPPEGLPFGAVEALSTMPGSYEKLLPTLKE